MPDRPKKPDPPLLSKIIILVVGSLIGAFFADLFFVPAAAYSAIRYDTAQAMRDCIVLSLGTLGGALLFSWASKR